MKKKPDYLEKVGRMKKGGKVGPTFQSIIKNAVIIFFAMKHP
jgi:hypothetical protein